VRSRKWQVVEVTNPGELLQATLGIVELLDPFLRLGEPVLQRVFERGEVRVQLDNTFGTLVASLMIGGPRY
jgi:hypothetical protein